MTRRRWLLSSAGIVLIVAVSALALTMRPRKIPDRAAIRADQLARLNFVAGRVTEYAREYHRPAYFLDSVAAHLDSAHAAEFRSYLTDLWGDPIEYDWNFTSFSLWSNAGTSNLRRAAAFDSAMRHAHLTWTSDHSADAEFDAKMSKLWSEVEQEIHIRAWYGWPEKAQRDSLRLKRQDLALRSNRSSDE
jgi:hypothetical protein